MRHEDEHDDEQKNEQDESVGYRRPPKRTRFQKGRSGNPHGRPKGTLNLETVLTRTIQEPVVITEHGRTTTITKLEAAIKQLTNKAASGDHRAIAQLVTLLQATDRQGHEPAPEPLSETDQRIMDRMVRRLARQAQKGGTPHGPDADPV